MARLSDTKAIVQKMRPDGTRVTNYEVRPVDNGFVTRKSVYDGNGGYSSSERFSRSEPCVEEPQAAEQTQRSELGAATRYLRGK